MEAVAAVFDTGTHHGAIHAETYLHGLLTQLPAKNMERMAEALPAANQQKLQQFLSDSPWAHQKLWAWVARRAQAHLGGQPHSMLLLDESAQTKKGDRSAGVARQYSGRQGKVDNCQVGVFAALALGTRATLVGGRLYLPEAWVSDPGRCAKAGIPAAEIQPRTKIDLAKELVTEALANGLIFPNVGVDCGYGRDQTFLNWIEDQGLGFVADVPTDLRVWEQGPAATTRPKNLGKAGARAVGKVAADWRAAGPGELVTLRVGENGPVRVRIWARRVWVWAEGAAAPRDRWLVVRQDGRQELKHTLLNAPTNTSVQELAILQGGRHFVERTFGDAKSHVGMGDYQVRKWLGWQHHMALVGLAMLFVLEERLLAAAAQPLLSVRDVVELMHYYFVAHPDLATLQAVMTQRHRRRERGKEAAIKQAERLEIT